MSTRCRCHRYTEDKHNPRLDRDGDGVVNKKLTILILSIFNISACYFIWISKEKIITPILIRNNDTSKFRYLLQEENQQ